MGGSVFRTVFFKNKEGPRYTYCVCLSVLSETKKNWWYFQFEIFSCVVTSLVWSIVVCCVTSKRWLSLVGVLLRSILAEWWNTKSMSLKFVVSMQRSYEWSQYIAIVKSERRRRRRSLLRGEDLSARREDGTTRRFKARVMRETALEDVCLIRELNSRSRNIARNNILFTSFRSLGKLI